jgi:glutamate-1-semialdehyde 2,1-aminomutase
MNIDNSIDKSLDKSRALFERAVKVMPGGVNSPDRAFKAAGLDPVFIDRAEGSKIYDADGNEYIDYVSSRGPLIHGHNNAAVREAVIQAAQKGISFGASTEAEIKLAEKIAAFAPGVEMVRMVNSGTEAVMSAIRLARAFTGRQKIIKFEGCRHGHSDNMLVKAGSGPLSSGAPDSLGVPDSYASDTLVGTYNDADGVEKLFWENEGVACVIVEPVAANMGVVLPKRDFLHGLRDICDINKAVLIFDETTTGFRLGLGGAQEYYNVQADLVTFGKIIGGGLPVGAYGGRKEIMNLIAPLGGVYQAGTLSGNPLAMAAGLAQISQLNSSVYKHLDLMGTALAEGLELIIVNTKIKALVNQIGSLVSLFFGIDSAEDYQSVSRADTNLYGRFFGEMLASGVYLAPSQFEAMFINTAHSMHDINETLNRAESAIKKIS